MVMLSRFAVAAALASLFSIASADLKILSPGGPDLWWVAQSSNTLIWTCEESPFENFTIFVNNSNPDILTSPIAIISIEQNFDCSKIISQDQSNQPAGSGYTVVLTNILNSSDIYATSEPFEIKALGAAYPPANATPTDSGTIAPTSTGGSSSAGSGSPTSSGGQASKSNGASSLEMSLGFGLAAIGALLGLATA